MYSSTYIVFFEADGLRYIPLRFEIPNALNQELREYQRTEFKRDTPADWRPTPHVFEGISWVPDDRAWTVADTLVITCARANAFWMISSKELAEARTRAQPIGVVP